LQHQERALLQNLSEQIRHCHERAAEAREGAEASRDPEAKADFVTMERRWLLLARSFELGERLDDFMRARTEPMSSRALDTRSMLQGRKHVEEADGWLASIVESSDDAIISKDLQGIICSWNAGAQRLFGYSPDEVVGRPITILIPADRQYEETVILNRLRSGERIENYETVRQRKDGSLVDISLTVSPVKNAKGEVIGASKIARDITERKRARELEMLFAAEMKHRIKNTLVMVQHIAAQTMHGASNEERVAFSDRLVVLASAFDLLTIKNWNRAFLRDVVERALKPFGDLFGERIALEGRADAWLDATKSSLLAMALHELATNAVKYGALSNASGRIRVAWDLVPESQATRINFAWLESNGPAVVEPTKRGFGSTIIEHALKSELGEVHLNFDPEGVTCVMEIKTSAER
jgi:PAS domain S-box-containing protein